jgi:hypothetical protein
MLFMVVENFGGNAAEVYRRFDECGRMMPEGLEYVSSWIDSDMKKCFQLMETEDESLFAKWTENWDDLVEFEIIPVMTSAEAREKIKKI